MVDPQQSADRVEHPSGVEGRDERQESAGAVREAGDRAGRVDRALLADREDRAARADRDDDVAGPGAEPQRGAGVVAGTAADATPGLVIDPLVGSEHAGQDRVMPERGGEQLAVVAARSQGPSSRCPRRPTDL